MPFGKAFVYQAPKRKKSEVFWSGLTGVVLSADTDYNLVGGNEQPQHAARFCRDQW